MPTLADRHWCHVLGLCVMARACFRVVAAQIWNWNALPGSEYHLISRTKISVSLNSSTQRRRDSAVELSRVGGVNTPVGSRDQVYSYFYDVEMRLVHVRQVR